MQNTNNIFKRIIFLLIILALFSVCTFAEDTGSSGVQNASDVDEENVKTEQAPGVQTQGMTTQAVPQGPSNPATQSNRFGDMSYQKIFNSNINDDVNISSGSMIINQTDLVLLGKNGLDLKISRTYNSRQFNSSAGYLTPYLSKLRQRIDEKKLSPKQIIKEEQDHQLNDYFSGYAGKGWEFNFGARLVAIDFVNMDAPSQAIVQIDGGASRFQYSKGTYKPLQKGVHDLVQGTKNGYVFIRKNGNKYYFEKICFERKFGYSFPSELNDNDSFEIRKYYLLTKIEDPLGNDIQYSYEDTGSSISNHTSKLKYIDANSSLPGLRTDIFTRVFVAGTNWGPTYEKERDQDSAAAGLASGGTFTFGFSISLPDLTFTAFNWAAAAWGAGVGLIAAGIDYVIELNNPKEIKYHDYLGYIIYPCRIKTVTDTYGRKVSFNYDPAESEGSQIDKIEYQDCNGVNRTIEYDYDNNGCLNRVVPPAGNPSEFNYQYIAQNISEEGFDHKGYLLTHIKYPSGADVNYKYSWYDPKNDTFPGVALMTKENEKDFSSYIAVNRTINGFNSWKYDFHGGEIYNTNISHTKDGDTWGFSKVDMTDPMGGTTNYEFLNGLVIKETNPAGHTTSYLWDLIKRNLVSQNIERGGSSTQTVYLNYDDFGNPGTVRESGLLNDPFDDRETHYEYMHQKSGAYKDKHIVDRISHQWVSRSGEVKGEVYFDYDSSGSGLLDSKKEMTDSGLAVTNYSYDQSGNMTSMTDPRGNSTQYGYGSGSPLPTSTSINVGGKLLNLARTYSQFTGALLSETDYNGNTARYSYDSIGRVIRKTNPDGTSITYTYNDMSNTIDIKDEKGEETTYVYDNQGRLTEVRQPENLSTKYTYNPLSKITSVRDAGGRSTGYQYDQIGRLTYINYPDGSGTGLSYQDSQNAVEVTDGNGNETKYKYDGLGNLTEVTEATGAKTNYSYDSLGELLGVKDPRNLITSYGYTTNGKLSLVKESDGSATIFSYDSAGNLKRKDDARGITTSFDYDEMNRLTNKRFSDSKYNIINNYDEPSSSNGMGALTSVDDMNGKTIFSYDTMGRLVKKDQPIDGKTFSIGYEYDQAGNIVKVKDPSNGATSYSVDGLGRITEVKRSSANGDQIIADYRYNPAGTIAGISFINGTKTDYVYDNRDRIKTLKVTDPQGNILVRQDMGYDSVGNRISLNSKNEESVQYEYDNLNRMTKVSYPKDTEEFHYDNAGNRTSLSHAFGKMDYVYDPASNKLLTIKINAQGKVNYSYDGNGNLIKEEHFSEDTPEDVINYKYDPGDRLIEIEKPIKKISGVDMPDIPSDRVDYSYDYAGMRIKKTTRNRETKYIYDPANRVICESAQNGDITASYVYANGQKIAMIMPNGSIQIFHNDLLGSPVLITDKDLKEMQRYMYEPFGNLVVTKGNSENQYTFTGKERDLESNLFYFGARYYNPILGRFISKDIAGPEYESPQTLNGYVYASNNPSKFIDPDGNIELNVIVNSFSVANKFPFYGSDLHYDQKHLVCNEYMQKVMVVSGYRDFPRSRIDQANWFANLPKDKGELILKSAASKFEPQIGDVVFTGGWESNKGHVEFIQAKKEINGRQYVSTTAASGPAFKNGVLAYHNNVVWQDWQKKINSPDFYAFGQMHIDYSMNQLSYYQNTINFLREDQGYNYGVGSLLSVGN